MPVSVFWSKSLKMPSNKDCGPTVQKEERGGGGTGGPRGGVLGKRRSRQLRFKASNMPLDMHGFLKRLR